MTALARSALGGSMKIEGHMSLIHRAWGSLEDTELLGAFSYQINAEKVARALISEQPHDVRLIVTDLESGKMTIISPPKKEEA